MTMSVAEERGPPKETQSYILTCIKSLDTYPGIELAVTGNMRCVPNRTLLCLVKGSMYMKLHTQNGPEIESGAIKAPLSLLWSCY